MDGEVGSRRGEICDCPHNGMPLRATRLFFCIRVLFVYRVNSLLGLTMLSIVIQRASQRRTFSEEDVFGQFQYTGWPPKISAFFVHLHFYRFSEWFHCQNQKKICNNTITKDPTTPQMCCHTTL